jgi:chromosomal replication initiator protein
MNTALLAYIKSSPMFQESISQAIAEFYNFSETGPIPSLDDIAGLVAIHFKISVADMKATTRKRELINARYVCIYLQSVYCKSTLKCIGDFFHKDHTTIIHARDTIKDLIDTKELVIVTAIDAIRPKIHEYWKEVIELKRA